VRAAIAWPVSELRDGVGVSLVLPEAGLVSVVQLTHREESVMSKFVANCVVMGVKARPSQDGKRIFRNAVLYFEEDTTTLEASISDEHEALYKQMEANRMKPAQVVVNLREYKGQRFLDVTAYQPVAAAHSAATAGK
jgi:hypothetical protein